MYRIMTSLPGRGRFDSQIENVFQRDVLRSTHLLTITKGDQAAGREDRRKRMKPGFEDRGPGNQ